jgi:hypothetical protein
MSDGHLEANPFASLIFNEPSMPPTAATKQSGQTNWPNKKPDHEISGEEEL